MKKIEVRFPLGKFVPIWHAINRGRITVAVGQYKRKEKLVCYSRTFFFFLSIQWTENQEICLEKLL